MEFNFCKITIRLSDTSIVFSNSCKSFSVLMALVLQPIAEFFSPDLITTFINWEQSSKVGSIIWDESNIIGNNELLYTAENYRINIKNQII